MATRIRAYGRLHFALVNLSNSGARINGGVGAMIGPPTLDVSVVPSVQLVVEPEKWQSEVAFIMKKLALHTPVAVTISIDPRMQWHVGLGFHTQLRLAIASALLFSLSIKFDPSRLASRLERGGTSSIGALGFWHGGLIFDGGHQRPSEMVKFSPSSSSTLRDIPPLLFHRPNLPFIPVIALGRGWELIHGELEREIFTHLTPIPASEASECARTVYMELQAATALADYDAFCDGVTALSSIGFKKRELDYRGEIAARLLDDMKLSGLRGVGMSSWGPACFGFARDEVAADRAIDYLLRSPHVEDAWACQFASGSTVSFDGGAELSAFELALQ